MEEKRDDKEKGNMKDMKRGEEERRREERRKGGEEVRRREVTSRIVWIMSTRT